jgi:hypothetical protein
MDQGDRMTRWSTVLCIVAVLPAAIVAHPSLLSYFIAIPTTIGLVFLVRHVGRREGRQEGRHA